MINHFLKLIPILFRITTLKQNENENDLHLHKIKIIMRKIYKQYEMWNENENI